MSGPSEISRCQMVGLYAVGSALQVGLATAAGTLAVLAVGNPVGATVGVIWAASTGGLGLVTNLGVELLKLKFPDADSPNGVASHPIVHLAKVVAFVAQLVFSYMLANALGMGLGLGSFIVLNLATIGIALGIIVALGLTIYAATRGCCRENGDGLIASALGQFNQQAADAYLSGQRGAAAVEGASAAASGGGGGGDFLGPDFARSVAAPAAQHLRRGLAIAAAAAARAPRAGGDGGGGGEEGDNAVVGEPGPARVDYDLEEDPTAAAPPGGAAAVATEGGSGAAAAAAPRRKRGHRDHGRDHGHAHAHVPT